MVQAMDTYAPAPEEKALGLRSMINSQTTWSHASETTIEKICSWLADEVVVEWLNDQTIWTKLLDFGKNKM